MVKRVILGLLILGACISLLQALNNAILRHEGSQDNQWGPSRALLEHRNPYAAYLHSPGASPFILSQNPNYPASGLIFLWPFAFLSWPAAKILWAFSNLLFTVVILLCLYRLLPPRTSTVAKVLLATLFVMGTPWRNGVGNGQHALFTLAFILLAVVLFPRSVLAAGSLLAVSWFKYTIAFPLTLFFARSKRGWATILTAAGIHAILTLFAAIWTGSSPVDLLLGPIQVSQIATGRGYSMDVFAITSTLRMPSKLIPGLAALAILGVTYLAARHDHDDLSCLCTLSIASMTLCFHGGYDFVVLVLPLVYALREHAKDTRSRYYMWVSRNSNTLIIKALRQCKNSNDKDLQYSPAQRVAELEA